MLEANGNSLFMREGIFNFTHNSFCLRGDRTDIHTSGRAGKE